VGLFQRSRRTPARRGSISIVTITTTTTTSVFGEMLMLALQMA
jgi:hypothetical protein